MYVFTMENHACEISIAVSEMVFLNTEYYLSCKTLYDEYQWIMHHWRPLSVVRISYNGSDIFPGYNAACQSAVYACNGFKNITILKVVQNSSTNNNFEDFFYLIPWYFYSLGLVKGSSLLHQTKLSAELES